MYKKLDDDTLNTILETGIDVFDYFTVEAPERNKVPLQ